MQRDVNLTEDERQLLVVLVTKAWVEIRDDLDMAVPTKELETILWKLTDAT